MSSTSLSWTRCLQFKIMSIFALPFLNIVLHGISPGRPGDALCSSSRTLLQRMMLSCLALTSLDFAQFCMNLAARRPGSFLLSRCSRRIKTPCPHWKLRVSKWKSTSRSVRRSLPPEHLAGIGWCSTHSRDVARLEMFSTFLTPLPNSRGPMLCTLCQWTSSWMRSRAMRWIAIHGNSGLEQFGNGTTLPCLRGPLASHGPALALLMDLTVTLNASIIPELFGQGSIYGACPASPRAHAVAGESDRRPCNGRSGCPLQCALPKNINMHTSTSIYIYLSIHPSIHLFSYVSIDRSVCRFFHLPISVSIHPSIHLFIYLSTYIYVHMCIYTHIYILSTSTSRSISSCVLT